MLVLGVYVCTSATYLWTCVCVCVGLLVPVRGWPGVHMCTLASHLSGSVCVCVCVWLIGPRRLVWPLFWMWSRDSIDPSTTQMHTHTQTLTHLSIFHRCHVWSPQWCELKLVKKNQIKSLSLSCPLHTTHLYAPLISPPHPSVHHHTITLCTFLSECFSLIQY